MKIGVRLSIWYFVVTLLILLTFSAGIFFGMQQLLYRTIDEDLNIFAQIIESSYNPLIGEFEELIWKFDSAKRYQELYLLVYGARGNLVFAAPMTQLLRLEIPFPSEGEQIGITLKSRVPKSIPFLKPDDNGFVPFRAISRRMIYRGRPIGWIQAALPIEDIDRAMNKLYGVILVLIGISVVLIAVGGYFMTRKSLHPIQIITSQANKISHSNLNERIAVQEKKDELGQLSDTLNDLLDRLQKAFLSQKQFLADAAHELKTPLAVLRTQWESKLNDPQVSQESKEQSVQDVEMIGRMGHLINNLLLLSQTEQQQENFEFKTVALDALLKDVAGDMAILAESKKQDFRISPMPETAVKGDSDRLYQLFFNLLDNAVKYTAEYGTIKVGLETEYNACKVFISDNGAGIAKNDLPRIFDRFYRVHKDRARKTGGSGLGLAICKVIAEAHGGRIEVDSEPGKGSTFWVYLPGESTIS